MSGLVGVDEAGRGPALGSMFVAAVAVASPEALPTGIADSKRLTDHRRETLADRLQAATDVTVSVREVTPDEIDRHAGRLNQLTARMHAAVIDEVLDGWSRAQPRCLVDACDVDEDRFARLVETEGTDRLVVDAEHGADETHPIVGAASVMAKSHRERHVAALAETYGDLGSGYPSDQTTRTFLERYVADNDCLPDCARESWKPCKELLAAREQQTLDGT